MDKTEEELKEILKEHFGKMLDGEEIEIEYINYAYDVEDFVESTSRLNLLYKQRALVKRWQKKQMKELKISKEELKADPSKIPPMPPLKQGCCSKLQLDLTKIEDEIIEVQNKIKEIE